MTERPRIRVFNVDDQEGSRAALEKQLEINPDKDIDLAGSHNQNDPELPDLIVASHADVAIVDIVLGPYLQLDELDRDPRTSGFAAIRAIRNRLEQRIRILAYSVYPDARDRAMDAGADGFLLKSASSKELYDAIRRVFQGQQLEVQQFWMRRISGLDLDMESRQATVTGESGQRRLISVGGGAFNFLCYLARERSREAGGLLLPKRRANSRW
jgi:DNA-binding NarL/FixJ family response regulator